MTEAITGLDLVELQLRVAGGEALPLTQDKVRFRGHAIEVRVCAEDADASFMPQSGVMALWQMPDGVRVEDALESGAEIAPFYDSMIAKLISHGGSRDEALRKLLAALDDAVALGVKTNQAFLASCLRHPVFAAGGATTAFIGAHGDELLQADGESLARAHALAAVMLYATAIDGASGRASSSIAHRLPIGFRFDVNAQCCVARLLSTGEHRYEVTIDARDFELQVVDLELNKVRFACNGLIENAAMVRDGVELLLQYRGASYRITDQSHATQVRQSAVSSDGKIRAAMNGRVVAVHVALGDLVKAGQPVLTLEAMKMEHAHTAPVGGRVSALNAALGDQIAVYRVIAEIDTDEPVVAAA